MEYEMRYEIRCLVDDEGRDGVTEGHIHDRERKGYASHLPGASM